MTMAEIEERVRQLIRHRRAERVRASMAPLQAWSSHIDRDLWRSLHVWTDRVTWRRKPLTNAIMSELIEAMLTGLSREGNRPLRVTSGERLRIRNLFRYATRLASKNTSHRATEELLEALRAGPPLPGWESGDPRTILGPVARRAAERHGLRVRAAVFGSDCREQVESFIRYLSRCTGYRMVPVSFGISLTRSPEATPATAASLPAVAYTDGTVIHLPFCVASTPDRELNRAYLASYLVAHQYLRFVAGSYRIDLSSPCGHRLAHRLRPLRRRQRISWRQLSDDVFRQLEDLGFKKSVIEPPGIHGIGLFLQHFRDMRLAFRLFYALEDGRLEMLIRQRWPGLAVIHGAHDRLESREVIPSSRFDSPVRSLVRAVLAYAAGRCRIMRLTAAHRGAYERAKTIVDRARMPCPSTVYDSAEATADLYELLESVVPVANESDDWHDITCVYEHQAPLACNSTFQSVLGIAVRASLATTHPGGDDLPASGAVRRPASRYWVTMPGVWLPEWDGGRLVSRAVHVKAYPFEPSKNYRPLPMLVRPLRVKTGPRRHGWGTRRWDPGGPFLAPEWLAQHRAGVKSGRLGTTLHYRRDDHDSALKVTLLFDLSISMEAPRRSLEGDTPIRRAIQFGTWLAGNLESQGVEVAAYGGIDGGRRRCELFELCRPVSRSIGSLRCVGAGGFRIGAFVRAIATAPELLGMKPVSCDHKILILTDGQPGYLRDSSEAFYAGLHRDRCGTCTKRYRCTYEIVSATSHVCESLAYNRQTEAYGDIAAAIEETGADVSIAYFGEIPSAVALRKAFDGPAFEDVLDAPLASTEFVKVYGPARAR